MISVFTVSSTDKSVDYLYQIFGSMNGVVKTGAIDITILSTMFKTFNTIILAIGTLIVLYVMIVGVIQTAHEGEFMGKKWNNIWIPIRTVLGIAALVPIGSGYSAIQLVMMWVILQGVGAANTVWNTALGYAANVGTMKGITIPTTNSTSAIKALFQGLVCYQTMSYQPSSTNTPYGTYYCNINSCTPPNFDEPGILNSTNTKYSMGPQDACGTLTYCNQQTACADLKQDSLTCYVCKAQKQALQDMIPTLARVAEQFVKLDYEYQIYYSESKKAADAATLSGTEVKVTPPDWIQNYCTTGNKQKCYGGGDLPSPLGSSSLDSGGPTSAAINMYWTYGLQPAFGNEDFITTASKYYKGLLSDAITSYLAVAGQNEELGGRLDEARSTGWIMAGRYYYVVASANNTKQKSADGTAFSIYPPAQTIADYRNNYQAASILLIAVSESAASSNTDTTGGTGDTTTTSSSSSTNPILNMVMSPVNDAVASANDAISATDTGVTNILYSMQAAGYAFMLAADVLFVAIVVAVFAFGLFGFLSPFGLGNGVVSSVPPLTIIGYMIVGPAIMLFLGLLVTYGGLLGVYIPLIPYVIFTFGAVGWFISVIEAMVAGPLVALGILSPSGQHELLGRSEPALMLLFNIFLRPTLMVFGLIAGMSLASVLVSMVQNAFWWATSTTQAQAVGFKFSITALIVYLGMYLTLIVAVVNKSFALIYMIPEKVIRWIGGHGEHFGEEQALGEMKGGAEKATSGAKDAGGQVAGRGMKAHANKAEEKMKSSGPGAAAKK